MRGASKRWEPWWELCWEPWWELCWWELWWEPLVGAIEAAARGSSVAEVMGCVVGALFASWERERVWASSCVL
jgi:hypothetical protein